MARSIAGKPCCKFRDRVIAGLVGSFKMKAMFLSGTKAEVYSTVAMYCPWGVSVMGKTVMRNANQSEWLMPSVYVLQSCRLLGRCQWS